MGNDNIVGN